jgi:hypothetical protein
MKLQKLHEMRYEGGSNYQRRSRFHHCRLHQSRRFAVTIDDNEVRADNRIVSSPPDGAVGRDVDALKIREGGSTSQRWQAAAAQLPRNFAPAVDNVDGSCNRMWAHVRVSALVQRDANLIERQRRLWAAAGAAARAGT